MIVALKISQLVQHVGRLAREAGDRLGAASGGSPQKIRAAIPPLGKNALQSLRGSLDAFGARDPQLALNGAYAGHAAKAAFGTVYDLCVRDPELERTRSADLALAANALTHIADLASEIAHLVHFAMTGQYSKVPPARLDSAEVFAR